MAQNIENPFGITVLGAASIEVEPDIAIVSFSIYPSFKTANQAFEASRAQAVKINQYFESLGLEAPKTGQITLRSTYGRNEKRDTVVGYEALIRFTARISQLDRLEFIMAGLVEAGITEINSTQFRSSLYPEHRQEARREAILAGRQKAEVLCETAGVKLGALLHIEDLDFKSDTATTDYMMAERDPSLIHAFNPSSIWVSASVRMAFALSE
jgi:uncharacterized protein YggE